MKKSNYLLRLVMLAMFVALGVVISPILRVEGMCPMAHLINITCAVFMGPAYALLCALLIGIIRMMIMGIPPLALTGAVFGATLSGVFYKLSKGKIIAAVLGEIIGTGLIGSIVSYPVMTYLWGKEGLTWFFYVPSFLMGTLIGGSIAFLLLLRLQAAGVLVKIQSSLRDTYLPVNGEMHVDSNDASGNEEAHTDKANSAENDKVHNCTKKSDKEQTA